MCFIEDEDVGRLWAIHFPKRDDIKSKGVCLTLYYMITDRAQTIVPYGAWSDKLHHATAYLERGGAGLPISRQVK